MVCDVSAKSSDLLERLANSIFDRDPTNPKPLFFSINEIHIVEQWLNDILNEQDKLEMYAGEYGRELGRECYNSSKPKTD